MSKWGPTSLSTTTLGYGCFEAVLFLVERAPNPENDSSEDGEVDNRLEKMHFADLVKDAKSVADFSFLSVNFELDGITSHKYDLPATYSFKMAASKVEF